MRSRLKDLGADGEVAGELDRRVSEALPTVISLSELTSPLIVSYVERVARPMGAMSAPAGARIGVRGYLAHLLVESDPAAFGVDDIPVLGSLPPLNRHGRLPQDLLTRVVKATRRQFPVICAVAPATWDGFVVATSGHVHTEARKAAGAGGGTTRGGPGSAGGSVGARPEPGYLDPLLVDGLLRTGWVLRQVDLAYGLEPDLRT
ncbi:MAG TPA: hypothetical protein VG184_03580 [Acidimicrobiales bacterium]|nr:hypothetical protein [Acidimicrobiales bacterium]